MAEPRQAPSRQSRRLFAYVALAAFAAQLLPEALVDRADEGAFVAPALASDRLHPRSRGTGADAAAPGHPWGLHGAPPPRTARKAVAVENVGLHVLNAMGAGAVAAVIQAALSAAAEPIVNRVLVKRMKVRDAFREVTPSMMLRYFKTTITTNFLKFPLFEAINAVCGLVPISPSVRGLVTGFLFTTATLPVTNFRYRKSMQLPVGWGNIYEAYPPTVIRDIVYAIARNYCTAWVLSLNAAWRAASPQVLFIVVILGCLISAPFNEWRGYKLQCKGKKLTFGEFFRPKNFVRSTSLGALQQGVALAVGYWCAPPANRFVHSLISAARGA